MWQRTGHSPLVAATIALESAEWRSAGWCGVVLVTGGALGRGGTVALSRPAGRRRPGALTWSLPPRDRSQCRCFDPIRSLTTSNTEISALTKPSAGNCAGDREGPWRRAAFWRDSTKKPARSRSTRAGCRALCGGFLQSRVKIFVPGGIEAAGGVREGEVPPVSAWRRSGTLGCRADGLVGG